MAWITVLFSQTLTLTKLPEEKLDENNTRQLQPVFHKSWKERYAKQKLYGHLSLISQKIKVR